MLRVKIDPTWSATQVGLRPVESGLGGHEEGVWGSTRGSRNIAPVMKTRTNDVVGRCYLQWFYRS